MQYYRNTIFLVPEYKCMDTDDGTYDKNSLGCNDYDGSRCGKYDNVDFNSTNMCCVCGGGKYLIINGKCLVMHSYIL